MHVLKTAAVVLTVAILAVVFILMTVNAVFQAVYSDFYKNSVRGFKIPGLDSGFVPQGVEETDGSILISGYMKNHTASRIYITDGKDSTHVEIFEPDGTPHTGHGGGIDVHGDRVFLTGNSDVQVLSLADIKDGDGRATVKSSFNPELSPAWCTVMSGYILFGSFASENIDAYPPKDSERMTTPAGDKNVGLAVGYKLDESSPTGINPEAKFAVSIGEKVQGLSFVDDGTIVLSTSYGLSSSYLTFHSVEKMLSARSEYVTESGKSVPLYYLDSASQTKQVKAPPMAEELLIKDGHIYIMNESACNKYIFGKFLGLKYIYGYKI